MRWQAGARGSWRWIAATTAGVLLGGMLVVAPAVLPEVAIAPAAATPADSHHNYCTHQAHPERDFIFTIEQFSPSGRYEFCLIQEGRTQQLIESWGWEYTAETRRIALVHHREEVAAATWLGLLHAFQQDRLGYSPLWSSFHRVLTKLIRPVGGWAYYSLEQWDILTNKCEFVAPVPGYDPCPPQHPKHMASMWMAPDRTANPAPTREELLEWGVVQAFEFDADNFGSPADRQRMHSTLRAMRQQLAEYDRLGVDIFVGNNREAQVDAIAALFTSTGVFSDDLEQPRLRAERIAHIVKEGMIDIGDLLTDNSPGILTSDVLHLFRASSLQVSLLGVTGHASDWNPVYWSDWVFRDASSLSMATLAFLVHGIEWTSALSAPAPDTSEARWFKLTSGDWVRYTQDLPLRIGLGDERVSARLLNDGTWVTTPSSGPARYSHELVYTGPGGDLKSLGVAPNHFRLLDLRGSAPGLPSCSLTPGCVLSPFFWARTSDEFDSMVTTKIELLSEPMILTDHIPASDSGTESVGTLLTTKVRAVASYDTTYRFEWEIRRNGGFVALIETEQDPAFSGLGGIGTLEYRVAIPGDYVITLRVHTLHSEVSEPWVQEITVPTPVDWSGQEQNDLLVTIHPDNWDGATAPSDMAEGQWQEYATTGSVCLTTGWTDGTHFYNIRHLTTNNFFLDAEEYWQGDNRVGWAKDADSDLGYTCFNRDPDAMQLAGSYRIAARTYVEGTCNDNPRREVTSGTEFVPGLFGCGATDDDATRFTLEIANQDPTTPVLETRWGASSANLNTDTGQVVGVVGDTITLAISRTGGIPERLSYEISWADDTSDELPNLRASFPAHDCVAEGVWCLIEHVFEAPVTGAAVTVVAVDRGGARSPVATQFFTVEPGAPTIIDRDTDLSDNNLATLSGMVVDPWLVSTKVVVDWQDGTATEEYDMPLPVNAEGRFSLGHHYGYQGTFAPTFTFSAGAEELGTVIWEQITTTNFLPVVLVEPIISTSAPENDVGPWPMGAWVLGYDANPADTVGVCVVWEYEYHPTVPTSQNPDVATSPDDSDSCTDEGGEYLFFPVNTGSFDDYLVPDHIYTTAGYYTIALFPVDLVGGSGADRNVGTPTFRTIAVGMTLSFEQQDALLPQVTGDPPIIRGIPAVGQRLVAELGLWQPDYTFPLGYYFQWLRDGVPIHDFDWGLHPLLYADPAYDWPNHGQNYIVQAEDQGKHLTVRVRSASPETQALRLTSDSVFVPYSVTWEGVGLGLQVDDLDEATKTVTVSGTYRDEGGYVVDRYIRWGDGVEEPFTATDLGFGYFEFQLTHSYSTADEYEIMATLVNQIGGEIPEVVSVDVPKSPAVWATLTATTVPNTLRVQVSGSYSDPEQWVSYGVIEWGDGDFSAFIIAGGAFSAEWMYAAPGTYQVTAILTAVGGETRSRTTQVVVPPPSGGGSSGSGTPGSGSTDEELPGDEGDPDTGEEPLTPTPEDPDDGGVAQPGDGSPDPGEGTPEPGASAVPFFVTLAVLVVLGAFFWFWVPPLLRRRQAALRE